MSFVEEGRPARTSPSACIESKCTCQRRLRWPTTALHPVRWPGREGSTPFLPGRGGRCRRCRRCCPCIPGSARPCHRGPVVSACGVHVRHRAVPAAAALVTVQLALRRRVAASALALPAARCHCASVPTPARGALRRLQHGWCLCSTGGVGTPPERVQQLSPVQPGGPLVSV